MGKLIDLTGKRFGKLVVLQRAKENINNRPAWICQCDCGNQKIVSGHNLSAGYTKSCGCLIKENAAKKIKEFQPGDKVGSWTILSKDNNKHNNNYIYWICQCDCGTIKSVSGHSLRTKESLSCGSCIRNSCIGEKYNELTIFAIDKEKTNNKNLYVQCQCNCGNIVSVQYARLKEGHPKSCGCKNYQSLGIYKIESLLKENNIPYEKEKNFQTCKFTDTHAYAYFDFYVNNSYLIEFDGKQHFYETNYFSYPLNKIKEHDEFKNKWCLENHIPLIRISYQNQNNIVLEDLLLKTSKYLIRGDSHISIKEENPLLR